MSDLTNSSLPTPETATGPLIEGATVTVKTKEALGKAGPWLKFIGVVGYIGVAVMVVFGLVAVIAAVLNPEGIGETSSLVIGILGFVYAVLAVVVFFPVRMLMRIAKAAKQYALQVTAAGLEAVAVNLQKLAKFYGIFTIVVLAIWVLVLLGVIAVGLFLAPLFFAH